jgi:hypothetical protein
MARSETPEAGEDWGGPAPSEPRRSQEQGRRDLLHGAEVPNRVTHA